jgi:hypothetical protein
LQFFQKNIENKRNWSGKTFTYFTKFANFVAMGLGKFFKKIFHNIGRVLGIVPSSAEKRLRRSLLDEQKRSEEVKKTAEEDLKRKKDQLIRLRRSINGGRKSLLSAWYDDGVPEQTIGS